MGYSTSLDGITDVVLDLHTLSPQKGLATLTNNNSATVSTSSGKIYGQTTFVAADSEYLSLANASCGDLDIGTSDYFVSLWVKADITNLGGSYCKLFGYGATGSSSPGFQVALRDTGRIYAYIGDGTTRTSVNNGTDSAITQDVWHWVLVTADRSGNMSVYIDDPVNAKSTGDISSYSSGDIQPTADLLIGHTVTGYYDGSLSNITFGKSLPTEEQRMDLFNNGMGREYGSEVARDYADDADVWQVTVKAKSTEIPGTATIDSPGPLWITAASLPDELIDSDLSSSEASGAPTLRASADAAGTEQLALKIFDFTPHATPASATALILIEPPSGGLDGTNGTDVYLWWNISGKTQPAAAHAYGAQGVYTPWFIDAWNEDVSGSDWDSSTWYAADGTLNNDAAGTSTTQIGNEAIEYDGTNDYISVTHKDSLDAGDKFFCSLWAHFDDITTSGRQSLFAKRDGSVTNYGLSFDGTAGGDVIDLYYYDGAFKLMSIAVTGNLSTTGFYHLAGKLVNNGSDLDKQFWIDGTSKHSSTDSSANLQVNNDNLIFGAADTTFLPDEDFDGILDCIWFMRYDPSTDQVGILTNNQDSPSDFWDSTSAAQQPNKIQGTGSYTMPSLTYSGTGDVVITGTGSYTMPSLTYSGTGDVVITGTGSYTIPSLTYSGAGDVVITGTGSYTMPSLTYSGAGDVVITGTGSYTAPSLTISGTGTVSSTGVTGTGSYTIPSLTYSGAGDIVITGTGSYTMPSLTIVGSDLSVVARNPFMVPEEIRIHRVRA